MKRYNEFVQKTDVELLAAISRREHGAMEALMDRYKELLSIIFHKYLKSKTLEKDAEQETWLKMIAWLNKGPCYEELNFCHLISKTARRVAISMWRKEHRELFIDTLPDEQEDVPAPERSRERDREEADELLRMLKPQSRRVVIDRVIDNMSAKETSTDLRIPLGTVLSSYYRSINSLRRDKRWTKRRGKNNFSPME